MTFFICKGLTLVLTVAVVLVIVVETFKVGFSLIFRMDMGPVATVAPDTADTALLLVTIFGFVEDPNGLTKAIGVIVEADTGVGVGADVGNLSTFGFTTVAFFNVDILGLPEDPCFGEFVPNGDFGLLDALLCFGLL